MLESIIGSQLTITTFAVCTAVSIALGICFAFLSMFKTKCSQSFAVTIAVLPAAVQLVIMLVNGNLGAGVAIAGAFSLVRFRSASGTAREIGEIFIAMTAGLACGMGYVVLAVIFSLVICALMLVLVCTGFGSSGENERILKITIPENMEYENAFDDLFTEYLDGFSLDKVKTSNMGTLYELQYRIKLKRGVTPPKAFIDELRCRNGNLNIACIRESTSDEL